MDRHEDAAVFDHALVALRLVFGNAHANERARDAADDTTYAHTCERGHNRTCCDKRPQSWDGERADSGEPTKRAADRGACAGARRCALGCLGAFLMRKVPCSFARRKKHRDVIVAKALDTELIDRLICLFGIGKDTEHRDVFRHVVLLSCFLSVPIGRRDYGFTSSSLLTLDAPAISVALCSTVAFSSSDSTGPLSVTVPSCAITFTLRASLESD